MSSTIEPEIVKVIDIGKNDSVSNRVSVNAEPDKWRIPPGRISASTRTPRKALGRISWSCDAGSNVIDASEGQSEKQDSPKTVAEAGK
jgi:hypothetical protein